MKLNQLQKAVTKSNKRLGRGLGSGKGRTAGRGSKGQKARGKMPVGFSGAGLPTYKKLPLRRGLGNRVISLKPKPINLNKLNIFKSKTVIDLEYLLKAKLIGEKDIKRGVKILSGGGLTQSLIIRLPVSKKAKIEIEKKGGKVENV